MIFVLDGYWSILLSQFVINDYSNIYRLDRNDDEGGISFFVKDILTSFPGNMFCFSNMAAIFCIELNLNKNGLYFTAMTLIRGEGGYLKCSIRGTNNQIRNRFYKSVHLELFNVKYKFVYLQLFNIKYKFVQLQLFDDKFLFSEEHTFCKQKRTVVYGRASLVSGSQLTQENDDLLSSRHK